MILIQRITHIMFKELNKWNGDIQNYYSALK